MVRVMSVRLTLFAALVWAAAGCGKDEPAKGAKPGTPSAGTQPAKPPAKPAAPRAMPKAPATYRVVLISTWTAARHPFEYPKDPRFSGLIGASHNAKYRLFGLRRLPTRGLERLAEEGKHSPMDEEIRAAIAAGAALAMFKTGGLKNFKDSLVTTVRVDPAHPMVSLVAMIVPSPDWFVGAANVDLVDTGAWVASRTVRLYAYDAGGDDGTTYRAPDRDVNPKKATTRAATRHFVKDGAPVPVATLRLIRQ